LRKIKIFPVIAFLTLIIISCNPVTSTQEPATITTAIPTIILEDTPSPSQGGGPQTEADVPRVSVEEAAAAIQSGEAVVLDVRSAQAYQASHIPGALSIPLAEIEANPTGLKLDKDKWIITYCT
jgi:3-mercaptopyruvate sulfurtransferase SseA